MVSSSKSSGACVRGENSDHGAGSAWPGAATGERIVILGGAGTAIDFHEAAQASGNEVLGFLEDDVGLGGQGLPVLGPLKFWRQRSWGEQAER